MTSLEPTPSQGRHVQANDLTVYFEEYGDGSPLILLHGRTVTSQMWQPAIASLAQHFRVLTPDSRGHGRTDNPAGHLSYRGLADDVVAFTEALGISQPLIYGYSDGGQIALEIGMRYPNFARGLVVGAAWYKFHEDYFNGLRAFGMNSPTEVDFAQAQRNFPDLVVRWQTAHPRPDDPMYWQTLIKQIAAMWYTPLDYTAEEFSRITAPTLILMGDRDGLIPLAQAVEMYQMIPHAELALLPNAHHGSTLAHVGTLPIVLDFLLRHNT